MPSRVCPCGLCMPMCIGESVVITNLSTVSAVAIRGEQRQFPFTIALLLYQWPSLLYFNKVFALQYSCSDEGTCMEIACAGES